jgi:hypothetical protein
MIVKSVAAVAEGDSKTDVNPNYATVTLTLANGDEITILVHQSTCYRDTVNVEIDGVMNGLNGAPHLRINMNERLIFDTADVKPNPYQDDDREPDMPEDEDDDEDGPELQTRVVESVGDPGKWQAQYHDPEMDLWFDIGDAQTDKAEAESRESDYRRAMERGQPQGFDDHDYDMGGDPMNDRDGDV